MTQGSETTMERNWATMGVSQPTPGGSGTIIEGSWATTRVSEATMRGSWATTEGSGATTEGSGATTGWCQVAFGWAGAALGWARSGLGWARSALAEARRRWDALATAWALALLFGLPQVGIFGQREVAPGESDCWATFAQPWGARAYVTWVALAVLVAPAVLLGVLQVAVTRALRGTRGVPGGPGGLGRARAKSHRMAVVVLGVFVLCWTPFFCAQLWAVWDPRAPREGERGQGDTGTGVGKWGHVGVGTWGCWDTGSRGQRDGGHEDGVTGTGGHGNVTGFGE